MPEEYKFRALTELKDVPEDNLSISQIQRKMCEGFPRAARIYDWLCGDVEIQPHNGFIKPVVKNLPERRSGRVFYVMRMRPEVFRFGAHNLQNDELIDI